MVLHDAVEEHREEAAVHDAGRALVRDRERRPCPWPGRRRPRSRTRGSTGCSRRCRARGRGTTRPSPAAAWPDPRRCARGRPRRERAPRPARRSAVSCSTAGSSSSAASTRPVTRRSSGGGALGLRERLDAERPARSSPCPSAGRGSARRSGCAGSATCPPRSCTGTTRGSRARHARRHVVGSRRCRGSRRPTQLHAELGDLLAAARCSGASPPSRGATGRRWLGLGDAHLRHAPQRFDARVEPADVPPEARRRRARVAAPSVRPRAAAATAA